MHYVLTLTSRRRHRGCTTSRTSTRSSSALGFPVIDPSPDTTFGVLVVVVVVAAAAAAHGIRIDILSLPSLPASHGRNS